MEKVEKTFVLNERIYTAVLKDGIVKVRYGIIDLPSTASPEIFKKAREVLGLTPARIVSFKNEDDV